ncbi:MAG: hypothetical protein COA58_04025 [Bacteroidetes bacterium]|nr:MAG: hypothetical protein COA58_04025 [Bacteroidota bacterium]
MNILNKILGQNKSGHSEDFEKFLHDYFTGNGMIKEKLIKLIIVLGVISFSACSINEKDRIGIKGYVKDELGNPLTDVSISYRTSAISVQTNSKGGFSLNEPRTFFIEFRKEGYHSLSTRINNFSEDASYHFNTITLKKTSNPDAKYKDISLDTDPDFKEINLIGNVLNSFKEPLKNVRLTLTDSIMESYSLSKYGNRNGYFDFRKNIHQITIKKEGFEELVMDLPIYEKDSLKITLLENSNGKGIYIIKSDRYVSLPQTKLPHESEEKIGSVLWGGNFSYDVTDFFYPNKVEEFKIQNDSVLRFISYEPLFGSRLFKAQDEDKYLCTVSYKFGISPFPETESVSVSTIYPPKYSRHTLDEPKIVEFSPVSTNSSYVFVNSKTKRGYYFTY